MPQYNIMPVRWYDIMSALYLDRQIKIPLEASKLFEPTNINDIITPLIWIDRVEAHRSEDGRRVTATGSFQFGEKNIPVTVEGVINANGWITGTMSW